MKAWISPADTGYQLSGVGGTCPAGSIVGTEYTTGAIVSDCDLHVTYEKLTYEVTPSASGGGTITPSEVQLVPHGETITFTLTADTGFEISEVAGTCSGHLENSTYITDPITDNCSVMVEFQTLPQVPEAPVLAVKEVAGDEAVFDNPSKRCRFISIEAYHDLQRPRSRRGNESALHLLNVNTGNFEISATSLAPIVKSQT